MSPYSLHFKIIKIFHSIIYIIRKANFFLYLRLHLSNHTCFYFVVFSFVPRKYMRELLFFTYKSIKLMFILLFFYDFDMLILLLLNFFYLFL
jgi:hypothetical protein